MNSIKQKNLRPTYASINLKNLGHNIKIAREMSNSDIIAIVKAGGYGHGAAAIAHYAYNTCSVQNFGVATISEGFALRESFKNPDPRIIVLGYADKVFYEDIIENNLMLTIFDHEMALSLNSYLEKVGKTAPVVIKIDTGMARLGFSTSLNLAEFGASYPRLKVMHVMSHLSASDDDAEYTLMQDKRFKDFLSKNSNSYDTSLYNSSAIANFKNDYSLTRPGLFMYGYVCGDTQIDLKPVMSIHSKVVHIQKILKGESVSYNRQFITDKDRWVGVVPIGYGDGYSRSLTNKGYMHIEGVKCPVLGRVCMDMTVIDVSTFGEQAYGKDVEIMGKNISATDIAKLVGTVEYEILCGISYRIPRIYDII